MRQSQGTYYAHVGEELSYLEGIAHPTQDDDILKFYLQGFDLGYYLGSTGGTLTIDYQKVEKW